MLSPLQPSALVAAVLLLTLVFLLGQAESSTAAMQPEMHTATSVRQPLELEGELEVKRTAGEPPFVVGENYSCVFGRAGQFSLHMPPQDYRDLGVHTKGLGIASNQDTLVCTVPKVVTAGNTTICVIPPNMSATHFPAFRPVGDSSYKQRPADITVGEARHVWCYTVRTKILGTLSAFCASLFTPPIFPGDRGCANIGAGPAGTREKENHDQRRI